MTKSPIINSLVAISYVVAIAVVMDWGTKRVAPVDNVLAPIAVISLFTLSAAVMGYIFLYQPGMLYMDGKKKQAVKLFLQTVGAFGIITVLALSLLFFGILASN